MPLTETKSSLKEEDASLLLWLKENGAMVDKVTWPVIVNGVRGVVANTHIDTSVPIFEIPSRLIMSPLKALESEELGDLVAEEEHLLVGDMVTILLLMHERGKKEKSFWWPYIRTLPQPGTIMDWCEEELQELQHDQLTVRCLARSGRLRLIYENIFLSELAPRYPEVFKHETSPNGVVVEPLDSWWDFDSFKFCHGTIQARAFGRRLPWTALVPFADLLNHANVQTKYELISTENKMNEGYFRLFPSGDNFYTPGEEVFNSYGRRPNDNLLLEYGFAMLDNMWDNVDIGTIASREEAAGSKWVTKRKLLLKAGLSVARPLRLRIMVLPDEDVDRLPTDYKSTANQSSVSFADIEKNVLEEMSSVSIHKENCPVGTALISLENERNALSSAIRKLETWMNSMPTTVAQDEHMLSDPKFSNNDALICSLRYRLTRKRIVSQHIEALSALHKELNRLALSREGIEPLELLGMPAPPIPPLDSFSAMIQPAVRIVRSACAVRSAEEVLS